MIKKVDKVDMVPDDIKELLLPDTGEYIAIGKNVYELHQFPVKKYFDLLGFISKYYTEYNMIFSQDSNRGITEFFGALAKQLKECGLIEEFMKTMFPELPDASDEITYSQLTYLLGVVYKLNFLSRNHQIRNMEMRNATNKMMKMLGLNLMND